jgi:hypothetical protein
MADVSIVTFRLANKCDMDASRGFDSQCIQNPNYHPTKSPIVEQTGQIRAAVAGAPTNSVSQ